MMKNVLIDRRTCLKGIGASLALPLLEAMGWADSPGQAVQTTGSPRIHVHAARRDHGSVLARRCGEFPVIAAAGPGIAAARARPVSADEGNLGSSDRSVQRRASRARTVHLAYGDAAESEQAESRSTSRFPRTRLPRITWALSPRCRRWNWPRCRRRTRKTRKG